MRPSQALLSKLHDQISLHQEKADVYDMIETIENILAEIVHEMGQLKPVEEVKEPENINVTQLKKGIRKDIKNNVSLITMVKKVREITGWGLKESLDFVRSLETKKYKAG